MSFRFARDRGIPVLLAVFASIASISGPVFAAATLPISPGTKELQIGVAGIVLPENVNGTFSAQIEARVGLFLKEALEAQVAGDVRLWPLGDKAPDSYGIGVNFLWYPKLYEDRNLYVLAGAGGALTDPPGPDDGGFDPLMRAGFGFKVPVSKFVFIPASFLTIEYRGEMLFADDSDFVSGAGLALSFFK